jgi:hypothetical protein
MCIHLDASMQWHISGCICMEYPKGHPPMKSHLTSLAAALALGLAGTAAADSGQLAASAGLAPAEASGLSLTEIAQAKFNHDTRGDDRQVIVRHEPASAAARQTLAENAGLATGAAKNLSLTEIAAAKFNHESGGTDQQRVERGSVTVAARSIRGNGEWRQLVASAGLSQPEAQGLSLTDIAAAKFDRDTD